MHTTRKMEGVNRMFYALPSQRSADLGSSADFDVHSYKGTTQINFFAPPAAPRPPGANYWVSPTNDFNVRWALHGDAITFTMSAITTGWIGSIIFPFHCDNHHEEYLVDMLKSDTESC